MPLACLSTHRGRNPYTLIGEPPAHDDVPLRKPSLIVLSHASEHALLQSMSHDDCTRPRAASVLLHTPERMYQDRTATASQETRLRCAPESTNAQQGRLGHRRG